MKFSIRSNNINYISLISIENIFQAWEEFKNGKRGKKDVKLFERHLEDNIFELHQKLDTKNYTHGRYTEFYVNDPKRRHIHKANVEDRIVHHLLYKYLYEIFDKTFIFDSYSCRIGKGTHRAVTRLEKFTRLISKNYARECWVLKLDIKKFFYSVDHIILKKLIAKRVKDENIVWLINQVIDSFPKEARLLKGIPLGNLTSQIFANIYLNELDQFVKHKLKIKYYLRYADDFIILSSEKETLSRLIDSLKRFLNAHLKLDLHPQKTVFRKLTWGIDFCGYIVLPHYRLVRTRTKRRIFKKISKSNISNQSMQSYLGYFKHASSFRIIQNLKNQAYFNSKST